jgi:hypothetical protein
MNAGRDSREARLAVAGSALLADETQVAVPYGRYTLFRTALGAVESGLSKRGATYESSRH